MKKLAFVILIGEEKVFEIPDAEVVTIGRSSIQDVKIPAGPISAKHLTLMRKDDKVFFVDVGSTNGTYFKGKKIAVGVEVEIKHGEIVQLGGVPLQLQIDGAELPKVKIVKIEDGEFEDAEKSGYGDGISDEELENLLADAIPESEESEESEDDFPKS